MQKYIYYLNMNKNNHGNVLCQSVLDDDGSTRYLHNEIYFNFKLEDGVMHITEGTHIGTEDFDFSLADGDDCKDYIDYYHPTLLTQILQENGWKEAV